MEKVNLFSFKVVFWRYTGLQLNQGAVSIAWSVAFIWTIGVAAGLIMVDSGTCLQREIPKAVFLC